MKKIPEVIINAIKSNQRMYFDLDTAIGQTMYDNFSEFLSEMSISDLIEFQKCMQLRKIAENLDLITHKMYDDM